MILLLLLVTLASARSPDPPIVFQSVDVFDGEQLLQDQDVVVRAGVVESVLPTGGITVETARMVTCKGCTLLPGLIDSHVHLNLDGSAPWMLPNVDPATNARRYLQAGVTSVIVAMSAKHEAHLARRVEAGHAILPHLYTAGPGLTAPGGHPIPLLREKVPWPIGGWMADVQPVASTPEEAREAVRKIKRQFDPPFLKIVYDEAPPGAPVLSPEVLGAAVAEAHVQGMRVVVHVASPQRYLEVADAGADLLMHSVCSARLDEEQLGRLREHGIPFVPTLRAVSWPRDLALGNVTDDERATIGAWRLRAFLHPPAHWDWMREAGYADLGGGTTQLVEENFVAMANAGIPFLAGTDGGVPGVFPGAGLHRELSRYVELGISPIDVLVSATSRPAAFLEPTGSFGHVASGQRADLLLVRGDPTHDIHALDDILMVCVSTGERTRCVEH